MSKVVSGETVALQALTWLAQNDDLLPIFLGSSGLTPQDLMRRAAEPEVLASILDFILMDDAWVVGFCDAEKLSYDTPMRARAALPGGETVNWT